MQKPEHQARSNPRSGTATRERIKRAARRLFAARGIEGVTVRDILAEAREKNGASLGYHFGSKQDLIDEITIDLISVRNAAWMEGLKKIEETNPNPTVGDYIRMYTESAFMNLEGYDKNTVLNLSESLFYDQKHVRKNVKDHNLRGFDIILSKIRDLLPHIPKEILDQRFVFLTQYNSRVFALCETAKFKQDAGQGSALWLEADAIGNMVDTAVGLITAPVADALGRSD